MIRLFTIPSTKNGEVGYGLMMYLLLQMTQKQQQHKQAMLKKYII